MDTREVSQPSISRTRFLSDNALLFYIALAKLSMHLPTNLADGEAGAIDFFGREYNLPGALSGHNNYWLWGRDNTAGEVIIQLGGSEEAPRAAYGEVIQAGIVMNDYCMPYENNVPVWICKNRRTPLREEGEKV
jgi:hypothetical protein